jgi:negative regulator of sigma E activity
VVSWVDNEFKSLIQADAYDASGKLLKQFSVGSFEKVDGVWMLKDMDMIDEQRETKTRLEFQLKVAR